MTITQVLAAVLMLNVPFEASNGDVKVTFALALHVISTPVKVMIIRAGKLMFCWCSGRGFKATSIRTSVADATAGTNVKVGDPTPIVDATKASSLPFVPLAMIDPAEFNKAECMFATAGCAAIAVVTLYRSNCKGELLLIEKGPDKVTLKTGAFDESAVIVADLNTIEP